MLTTPSVKEFSCWGELSFFSFCEHTCHTLQGTPEKLLQNSSDLSLSLSWISWTEGRLWVTPALLTKCSDGTLTAETSCNSGFQSAAISLFWTVFFIWPLDLFLPSQAARFLWPSLAGMEIWRDFDSCWRNLNAFSPFLSLTFQARTSQVYLTEICVDSGGTN